MLTRNKLEVGSKFLLLRCDLVEEATEKLLNLQRVLGDHFLTVCLLVKQYGALFLWKLLFVVLPSFI